MTVREIKHNICSVGAIDWDRRLFDALIPLPDGTSYNSYLIKGSEKTALIDTVNPTMGDVLINHLNQLGVENVNYVVVHHAEQDHSGALPQVLGKYPQAKVIVTPDEVYFVESLPKTRSGKIMRRVLKAVASEQSLGDLTTLEDEASVEEVKKAYESLRKMSGAAKED